MLSEEKDLILRAARLLLDVAEQKRKIVCLSNGRLFADNDFGYANFDVDGNLFQIFCKAGGFRYVDSFTLIEEKQIVCDWFFPDDVIRLVLGNDVLKQMEKLVKEAAKLQDADNL